MHQLRSVTQSLAWIARQTHRHAAIFLMASRRYNALLKMLVLKTCVSEVEWLNLLFLHPHVSSVFLQIFFRDDAVVVTVSDAGFCQEQEQVGGIKREFRSQQACITALAAGNALNREKILIHPLSRSPTRIRRVCQSTLLTEAYALSNAVEQGLRNRAIVVDMRGHINIRQ